MSPWLGRLGNHSPRVRLKFKLLTTEAEISVSGKAECLLAVGEDKNVGFFGVADLGERDGGARPLSLFWVKKNRRRKKSPQGKQKTIGLSPLAQGLDTTPRLSPRSGSATGPVQTGKIWRRNAIKHSLVTKHCDVVLSGQTVSNMFE